METITFCFAPLIWEIRIALKAISHPFDRKVVFVIILPQVIFAVSSYAHGNCESSDEEILLCLKKLASCPVKQVAQMAQTTEPYCPSSSNVSTTSIRVYDLPTLNAIAYIGGYVAKRVHAVHP